MNQYIARQPIFDKDLKLIAYELLYVDEVGIIDNKNDKNQKSLKAILRDSMQDDIRRIVANKFVYIDYTQQIVNDEAVPFLDPDHLIIEVSANVDYSEATINALSKIKSIGYRIALNKVNVILPDEELIRVADIAKIDFMQTTPADRKVLTKQLSRYNLILLGTNVKDRKAYQEAIDDGFQLFQGFFFAKPNLVSTKNVKSLGVNHIRLIGELFKAHPSFDVLTAIVESDVSMSFKLLKLINSAVFYRSNKIHSINQALVMLGLKELRKWATLIMLDESCQGKPDELIRLALVRAKIMEMLCGRLKLNCDTSEAFLVGLLSLIDVMLDNDMTQILKELPLDDELVVALTDKSNQLGQMLNMIEMYEESEFESFKPLAQQLNIDTQVLPYIYFEALEWTEQLLKDL